MGPERRTGQRKQEQRQNNDSKQSKEEWGGGGGRNGAVCLSTRRGEAANDDKTQEAKKDFGAKLVGHTKYEKHRGRTNDGQPTEYRTRTRHQAQHGEKAAISSPAAAYRVLLCPAMA
ncbi:hypothetical protein BDFG_04425 [Blastomyces dermatitidis ATCC 26199]|nr:hypothetical protein BDFG_04425 [Blastomyces dermatitidis ATCC 26199]